MTRRKRVARALAAALAAAGVAASTAPNAVAADRCDEDEPCWVWSTMGNLERGVILKGSARVRVVSPCTFARLHRHKRIDWNRTYTLRGDSFARKHGCDVRYYPEGQ